MSKTFNSGQPLILHTADLHVGDSRNLPGYLDRQQQMLSEITRIAIEREVDAILISGDAFDAKYTLPRERDLFLKWLAENDHQAEQKDFWVVVMNGNHDEIEEGYTQLHSHKIMMEHGMFRRTIVVEDAPQVVGPFKEKIFVAALPAKNYKGEEVNFTVEALYKTWASKLEAKGGDPKSMYFVVMLHEAIFGAVNERGDYKVKHGPKLDPELPVTYWALGDIHNPFQQVMANAWYPGSPMQHDFGDLASERGVLVVALDSPTEPEPVFLEGIVPLITLSEIPDEWPTGAIIRYEGTAEEISETLFPDNVIGFKPVIDDTIRSVVDTEGHDLLSDLPEVMVDQGVPEDLQGEVLNEIESVIASL